MLFHLFCRLTHFRQRQSVQTRTRTQLFGFLARVLLAICRYNLRRKSQKKIDINLHLFCSLTSMKLKVWGGSERQAYVFYCIEGVIGVPIDLVA